jgi:hypothetical protein
MIEVRTLRRSTERANVAALGAFEVLGLFVLGLGIARSSVLLMVLGLLYAGGMAWYLIHLFTRVASKLRLDTTSGDFSWFALSRHGRCALSSVESVRQTFQPDVYAFVLRDGSLVRFWHRNRNDEAQKFFRELHDRRTDVSFEPLYLGSRTSWRRGLPPINESTPQSTGP